MSELSHRWGEGILLGRGTLLGYMVCKEECRDGKWRLTKVVCAEWFEACGGLDGYDRYTYVKRVFNMRWRHKHIIPG